MVEVEREKGRGDGYWLQVNFPEEFIRLNNPWDVIWLALEIDAAEVLGTLVKNLGGNQGAKRPLLSRRG